MPVTKSTFNKENNVTLYTLSNGKLTVKIIDYGATIVSIIFADRNNVARDLVLGFDDLDGYQSKRLPNPYFGASIGRIGNRIANSTFKLNGQTYSVPANNGPNLVNSLHGGLKGFDKRQWTLVGEGEASITLQYISADGEEGYPGQLKVDIKFSVTADSELKLEYTANLLTASVSTIVNLTNHSYFNLNGAFNAESSKILNHLVLMQAGKYLEVDAGSIPTGAILPTKGTLLDFSEPRTIGERAQQIPPRGYDFCYVLEDNVANFQIDPTVLKKMVEVYSPLSGIKLTMSTTDPAVQFYTGGAIAQGHKPKKSQTTDGSVELGPYSGFCLEAQRYVNAVNNDQWRKQVLLTGEKPYRQTTVYKFELSGSI